MKKIFTILLTSTVLALGAGLPAESAMRAEPAKIADNDLIKLASDDDHDAGDHQGAHRDLSDDVEQDGEDDDDDDEDGLGSMSGNPAPVGTVAPPANGLFGSTARPQVTVN